MKKLMIPENILLDKEYLPGIGKRELPRLLSFSIPGLTVLIILWTAMQDPGSKLIVMLCCLGYLAICYTAIARVDQKQSIYTYIARIIRFQRSQKNYYYKNPR